MKTMLATEEEEINLLRKLSRKYVPIHILDTEYMKIELLK